MTYCVGAMIDAGLVFASDSRTNAGIDNVSTYRKMKVFENAGDRVIVVLSSGNLAITQATLAQLEQIIKRGNVPNLMSVGSMYEATELIGAALRQVRERDGLHLQQNNVDAGANFIVGGQIAGEPMRLFLVYAEGNFIEATPETPYFQIGETKYGKPIIDRIVNKDTTMLRTVKCVLVSFDSTMRSNLSVGMPIDLVCYARDDLRVLHSRHLDESDEYMRRLRILWGEGLNRAFAELPPPDWMA
ncbi:MAG: proteasome-type protease [Sulfuritalea sp.]|nr:proteasome-type protease [Sulfuritalea sp.]